MSSEEMKHLEEWLRKNPQYNITVAIIKQQVDALVNAAGRVMA
jgi:hypothetical protein